MVDPALRPEVSPGACPIHFLFEAQEARTPGAEAVASGDEVLTYAELNRRANRLAHHLRANGAGPEERVGVCLDRTPELIVSLLAVLKSGAAYVPLDPAYPRERVALTLRDAGASLVVTRERLVPLLDGYGGDLVRVDADLEGIAQEAEENPRSGVAPHNLAYLIYTSGSTGTPKGVQIEHRSAAALLDWCRGTWTAEECAGVLASTSVCFDMSVFEIFHTLAVGGKIILAENALALPHLPAHEQVTLVNTVPAAAAELLRGGGIPRSVRVVNLGGEPLRGALARGLYGLAHVDKVYNLYGPSEDTTYSTSLLVPRGDDGEPTVGRPITGTRLHLLDEALAPVPEGEVGEVYLAGTGLARDYLGRPELTAERFLPDPSGEPGSRMYRVGDLGRVLPNGEVQCLGRIDHQVKVRGFRVELGEVEAVLERHPAVREAVVAAREGASGERRLVAYVVPAGEGASAGVLREHLRARLPEYMVPSALVILDALPLLPNGKVDRGDLPAPDPALYAAGAEHVPPRTPVEEGLARIWSEVLGVERVGVRDSFFDLGGHSLALIRVGSRVREAFGVEVPVGTLFRAATVEELARALGEAGGAGVLPLVRVPRGEDLPLAYSQERVWFIQQLAPENLSYHFQLSLSFRGRLDVGALERSLTELVHRHEILHTAFPTVRERPVQRIGRPWRVRLPVVDLASLPEEERPGAARRWMEDELRRRFDLARLPLIRWSLLRLAPDRHLLVHVEHHIIHDGWSVNVLLGELVALYRAETSGEDAGLPELPVQFADYAVWQREWMKGEEARAQLASWKERLAGSRPVLDLPFDRSRPPVQRFRGAAPRFRIPGALYRPLRELARAEGATLFMVMLAGFDVLLARYARQDDLNVGTGIATRRHRELEGVVGMFVNSVVLRCELGGDPTFRELLARVREATLAAYANQDLPFDAVVEAVRPDRHPGRNPLFQAMFSFHDSAAPALRLPGLETELTVGLSNGSAKFDLNVIAIPHADHPAYHAPGVDPEAVTLVWEYDSDLFDAATMERMFSHFRTVLESAVADPDARVPELRLLGEEERGQLLRAGSATRSFPVEGTLPRGVEGWAARTPGAVAVRCGEEALTYAELNARANRLAHHLRRRGVAEGTRVGVALERSPEMVVAIVAILRAGGAYVPLDPAYPAARLAFLLEDAGVPVLVTTERLRGGLPPFTGGVVSLDGDAGAIGIEPAADPGSGAGPQSPAYVIYTSGSTGTPKGVVVTHANVLRLFAATEAWFGFGAEDVWTLFHSYAFDFSVWEIWGALLHGGRLVVVPFAVSRDPGAFRALLAREGVTVLSQTPSAFRQLVEADRLAGAADGELALRTVVFGGEALEPAMLRPWVERHGDERPRLVNMYGITETTVHVTGRVITREDVERGAGSPIGIPIPDLSLHLLDDRLQPVPVGVPGEICVGGAGVAPGYLNRPELTAQRFVRDPFSAEPGARLYRSGDLARRLSSGELEYLGRADQQVKVRGFRIEPGEVAAALLGCPGVGEAVVVARTDAGEPRLVAYVVPAAGGTPPAPGAMREHLQRSLPEHMVPAAFVPLAAIPLTAHGKLDREALPAPDGAALGTAEYVPPRTPAERVLAEVWRQVLGVERVGIDDNYFAVGGDSIRSVRIVAEAGRRGVGVSLPQLFRHQTVRDLAAAADTAHGSAPDRPRSAPFSLVPEEVRRGLPEGVEDAYPPTLLQLGMLYHSERRPESTLYRNVNSYRVETRFDEAAMREAAARLAARHPVLRTSFDLATYPEPLQLVWRAAAIPLQVEDLRPLSAGEQELRLEAMVREEAHRRFDWTRPPLLRFRAHLRGEACFQFTFCEHHAVLDGWSAASMVTELLRTFLALRDGKPDPMAEAPALAFREYVALEREAVGSEAHREFWTRLAADGSPSTLPGRSASDGAGGDPRSVHVDVPPEVSGRLKRVAEEAGVPLKSVLLAAHLRVLALVSGSPEVLTGVVANGRPEAEDAERVLGLFLNTVPFRVEVGEGSWVELARRAFELEGEILPFRRYPLAEMQRVLGWRPVGDAGFNFIHFHVYRALAGTEGVGLRGERFFQETEFPLMANFYLDWTTGAVRCRLDHDPRALGAGEVDLLAGHYARALHALALDPRAPAAAAPLLPEAERARVLAWGKGDPVETDACVHALFAEQARRTPGAVALVSAGGALTYAEVEREANQLARLLRRRGVGPGSRVGLCLERSPAAVVAILGILKAGGAYVPLDPGHPEARLALLLRDAGVRLVVSAAGLRGRLPSGTGVLCLDAAAEERGRESPEAPEVAADPEGLAYVMYTSGSTGTPKGVMVPHRAVVRLARGSGHALFSPDEVFLQLAPLSFDASTLEIWGALLHGARLVVAPARAPSLEELDELAARHGVTTLWLTAGLFHSLVDARPEALRGVRQLLAGGDVLSPAHVRRAREAFPGLRLVNGYGPTENTTFTCCHVATGDDVASVPVGRPVAGTRVYVLDAGMAPVPVGVPGELYAGGAGVARGYLGRPELTAERFVPDPFPDAPGARLYRTGDRVRWLASGEVEFLGRADAQVKVRGFRVEPGEVEAALREHPRVREAVVAVRGEGAGEKRLVAYVTGEGGGGPWGAEVRDHLRARLPEPMVPAAVVVLERLPLTPNGKVDRRALPDPREEAADGGDGYLAPRTSVEDTLARIWSEALRVERVGVHDDFFDLGGDSLVSLRIVARVGEAFGVRLSPGDLYDAPTVERMAVAVAREQIRALAGEGLGEAALRALLAGEPGELELEA